MNFSIHNIFSKLKNCLHFFLTDNISLHSNISDSKFDTISEGRFENLPSIKLETKFEGAKNEVKKSFGFSLTKLSEKMKNNSLTRSILDVTEDGLLDEYDLISNISADEDNDEMFLKLQVRLYELIVDTAYYAKA